VRQIQQIQHHRGRNNALSNKFENFQAVVALQFGYYNFVRFHKPRRMTPAMAIAVLKQPPITSPLDAVRT